ncbi:MAG TPA: efflux RND transporter periplasmic adaptor subunit [Polyangiaceae bacterium]|nr:efflux RND transporter periplasmic adaptor subunit [Polyangiaceae bacterium]
MKRLRIVVVLCVLVLGAIAAYVVGARPKPLVLTGIVTTEDVIVSPQIGGQVSRLLVREGDSVTQDELLAVIAPDELKADETYYSQSAEGLAGQVQESEAALRYQEQETVQQIEQARALVAAAEAQRVEAAADFNNAKTENDRVKALAESGAVTVQEVDRQRTTFETSKAKLDAAERQLDAQRAALALATAARDEVAVKRSALAAAEHARAAAAAQTAKAAVRVGYTEIRAPVTGMVDVRAVRQGEYVPAGDPIVTLIDPDDLWVRVDVEESYIDRIRIGDFLPVRLASGETRPGKVFYRGIDAGFATQRDVSRTKRDIKTFEVRLRVDNHDRRLAVGMTAYVLFSTS